MLCVALKLLHRPSFDSGEADFHDFPQKISNGVARVVTAYRIHCEWHALQLSIRLKTQEKNEKEAEEKFLNFHIQSVAKNLTPLFKR